MTIFGNRHCRLGCITCMCSLPVKLLVAEVGWEEAVELPAAGASWGRMASSRIATFCSAPLVYIALYFMADPVGHREATILVVRGVMEFFLSW